MIGASSLLHQVWVIAGKELAELRRQPTVLLLVVIGPFAVLAAFGLGYRNEPLALRTVFVGTADGPYAEAMERYSTAIDDYLIPLGFTTDFFAAVEDLEAGRLDLVIVLPPDLETAILERRRSEIAVLHNSIDPIEQIGIEFATEVAVRELNSTIVTASLETLLASLGRLDVTGAELAGLVDDLDDAVEAGDGTELAARSEALRRRLNDVTPTFDLIGIDPDPGGASGSPDVQTTEGGRSATISRVLEQLDRIERDGSDGQSVDAQRVDDLRGEVERIGVRIDRLLSLDSATLSRPFTGDAESLVRSRVTAEDHVAPGATALLIQHLGVSLAALSLVRDRRRGILDDYRVGPTAVVAVMLGKLVALSGVAMIAGGALMAGQIILLDIPMRGSLLALVAVTTGLTLASVSTGLVVASLGRSELQASQLSMMVLFIALFFSGFLLDLGRVLEPFRSLGSIVPATPAVSALRDIQLRGEPPGVTASAQLAVQATLGLLIASVVLTRQWRPRS